MLRNTIILAGCLIEVVACAGHPREAVGSREICHTEYLTPGEQLQIVPPDKAPALNLRASLQRYAYPDDLSRQHLQGRALVRLKVAEHGKVDSAQFLRVDAPPPVSAAMCDLVGRLRYELPNPDFATADSRTFVVGVKYCLGNCDRVPSYVGFEKHEITVTGSPPPER